jgi:iron(III) transport system substrate-binding protein
MKAIVTRKWRGVALLAAVAMAAVGCSSSHSSASGKWATATTASGSMSQLISAAKAEGSLTIFTPVVQSEVQQWAASFTKEYGIKVNIYREASSILGTTFTTQQNAGKNQADIYQTSNLGQVQQFIKEGWFAKYVPQSAGDYPASRTVSDYAYPLYQSTGAIAWNTQVVPASVQKELEANPYQGLLDPALKGKIVLIDPSVGGSGMAYYANLVDNLSSQYGWSYLQKLAAQKPAVASSIQTISQEVSAGTYYVTIFGDDAIFGPLAQSGSPVRFSSISPMNATLFYQEVPSAAPHPAAARLWDEWSESLAGQEAMTAATGGSSSIKGWTDNRPFAKDLSWYKMPSQVWLSWQSDSALTGDQLTQFVTKWDSIFHVSSSS